MATRRRYAAGTSVGVDKTRAELERLLSSYGATQRMVGVDDTRNEAIVMFSIDRRQVRMRVPLPNLTEIADSKPRATPKGVEAAWSQACRERWRAVLLLTKAKLEAASSGLSTVEREFLSDVVMPDGSTVHDSTRETIALAYTTGKMPPLLGPAPPGAR